MGIFEVILIGIALSIDVFVVSFACGLALPKKCIKNALLLAVFTSIAQGLMPIIGYFCTQPIYKYVSYSSKYLIFAIFMYLGIKFIKEAFVKDKETIACLTLFRLLIIAFATGVDTFAMGISFSLMSIKIFMPAGIIAFTTFVFAILGYSFGCFLKKFTTIYLEIFAGLILILLAFKSLF